VKLRSPPSGTVSTTVSTSFGSRWWITTDPVGTHPPPGFDSDPLSVTSEPVATLDADATRPSPVGSLSPPTSWVKTVAAPERPAPSAPARSAPPSPERSPTDVAASPPVTPVAGNTHGGDRPPPVGCTYTRSFPFAKVARSPRPSPFRSPTSSAEKLGPPTEVNEPNLPAPAPGAQASPAPTSATTRSAAPSSFTSARNDRVTAEGSGTDDLANVCSDGSWTNTSTVSLAEPSTAKSVRPSPSMSPSDKPAL